MLPQQAQGAGMSLPGYGPQRGVYRQDGSRLECSMGFQAWAVGVPGVEVTLMLGPLVWNQHP